MDTNSLVSGVPTFGLLFFAGMQWWVTHQGETRQLEERRAREEAAQRATERAIDIAFQTVWAEHFRLDGLAGAWADADLVRLSALNLLRADDALLQSWPTLMTALGVLGTEAGILGSVAATLAHDVARSVALLNSLVENYARQYPKMSGEELVEMVRRNSSDVSEIEDHIRRGIRELANAVWDAARHSPRADTLRELRFADDLESSFARDAINALNLRSLTPPKPVRGRKDTKGGAPDASN